MIIKDSDLFEDNDQANEFSIIIRNDRTKLDKIEY